MCFWVIPVAVTAASGVFSAISGYNQAKSQNAMLEYNAKVAEYNAKVKENEASYARGQAARNAAEQRKQTAQLIAAQRAKMGASGAVVGSGSFLDVTMNTAETGARDAMALLQEGDISAWRHEIEAGNYKHQAQSYLASRVSPGSVLAGGLLSAAASTAVSYSAFSGFGGAGAGAKGFNNMSTIMSDDFTKNYSMKGFGFV